MINKTFVNCDIEYFDVKSSSLHSDLKHCISKRMELLNYENVTPIILCIGTDRATGDCLGPLVGEKLKNSNLNCDIYGTLDSPVHALNIRETINYITSSYKNPFIIAIDAALGNESHIGYVTVSNCPIEPGKGVNKKLPVIGDISITGIVNVSGRHEGVLQSTRLYIVMKLADSIANALHECLV